MNIHICSELKARIRNIDLEMCYRGYGFDGNQCFADTIVRNDSIDYAYAPTEMTAYIPHHFCNIICSYNGIIIGSNEKIKS